MEESLPMLQKALKGLVVMSSDLEAMGQNIFINAVPGVKFFIRRGGGKISEALWV